MPTLPSFSSFDPPIIAMDTSDPTTTVAAQTTLTVATAISPTLQPVPAASTSSSTPGSPAVSLVPAATTLSSATVSSPTSTVSLASTSSTTTVSYAKATSTGARPLPPKRWTFHSSPAPTAKPGTPPRLHLTAAHGVIVDSTFYPAYTNQDYFAAIKRQLVPPHQVHSYSRVQGTFQVFFLDSSWAKQLITTGLSMHDCCVVPCNPVGIPPTRVVISDVPSHFENQYLRAMLSDFGTVVGPLKTLRASLQDPDFPHLLSFRRQALLKLNPSTVLPDRVFVDFNGAPQTFFLSTGLKCYQCGVDGHVRSACPGLISTGSPTTAAPVPPVPGPSAVTLNLTPITPTAPPTPGPVSSAPKSAVVSSVSLPPLAVSTLTSVVSPPPSSLFKTPSTSQGPLKRVASTPEAYVAEAKRLANDPTDLVDVTSDTLSGVSDCSYTSDALDDDLLSSAVVSALSDVELRRFFDDIYQSKVPILTHVRQYIDDPLVLLKQISALRLDASAFAASLVAKRFTGGSLYQYERKIRKALSAERRLAFAT